MGVPKMLIAPKSPEPPPGPLEQPASARTSAAARDLVRIG
jgi:hypothetical protein